MHYLKIDDKLGIWEEELRMNEFKITLKRVQNFLKFTIEVIISSPMNWFSDIRSSFVGPPWSDNKIRRNDENGFCVFSNHKRTWLHMWRSQNIGCTKINTNKLPLRHRWWSFPRSPIVSAVTIKHVRPLCRPNQHIHFLLTTFDVFKIQPCSRRCVWQTWFEQPQNAAFSLYWC